MTRIGALAISLALLAAACGTNTIGGSPDAAGSDTTTTTEPVPGSTTTSPVETTSTTASPSATTTAPATTTTTVAPGATPTTAPATNGSDSAPQMLGVAAYFYLDEPGRPSRQGPFLAPIHRESPHTKAVARAAIEHLLAGPTGDEAAGVPSISTTIPEGVRLLGLNIADGMATIDLSSGFGAAAGAEGFAQVVFTLTRFPTVDRVVFHRDGVAVEAPVGGGQLVSRPVDRSDYLQHAAGLSIEQPTFAAEGGNPLRVTGFGSVFEASFRYVLTDAHGLIIAEGGAMTDEGQGWGRFDFTVPYQIAERQLGALIVWANSAEDGSRIDVREYPVALVP